MPATYKLEDREGRLHLLIDIELEPPRPSSTGKTNMRFTTSGFRWPEQTGVKGLGISINVVESKR